MHEDPAGGSLEVTRPWRSKRRRWLVPAGVLVLAAGAVAVLASGAFSGSPHRMGVSALSRAVGTATVTRRDLVSQDSESGTLGYGDTRAVINRMAGTITSLPAAGTVIPTGGVLYEMDAKPVVLLDGSVPAYRALSASDSAGPDILELKRSLASLGYDAAGAIGSGDAWDAGTSAAVQRLQAAHGLAQTGKLELGRVVFLPGARRVAALSATVGSSGGGGGGSGASAAGAASGASLSLGSGGFHVVPAVYTTPQQTQKAKKKKKKKGKVKTPSRTPAPARRTSPRAATTTRAAATPSTASSSRGSAGTGSGAASPSFQIMTTTSTRQVVTVALDTGKTALARPGGAISIQLPSGGYVHGHVASVGRVAQSSAASSGSGAAAGSGASSSSSSSATVTVTVSLDRAQSAALDQAPVTVLFTQSVARHVLSVPVTALIATPGGGYAVEVVNATGHRLVSVTPGLYTSGYVEVNGDLAVGNVVTNASE